MGQEFEYDVFLSHSAKDKALVHASSLSGSTGERAGVRCRNLDLAERLRTGRAEAAGRRRKNGLQDRPARRCAPQAPQEERQHYITLKSFPGKSLIIRPR
jgi:predicted ATPase